MSSSHDRQFTNLFSIVLGVLVGIAVGIYFLSNYVGRTQRVEMRDDPEFQREIDARIEPVGRVAIAGKDNSALTAAEAPAPAVSAAGATADLSGEEVYNSACVACHGAGIGGAPRFADKAAWAPRIANGMDVLRDHALHGFQGKGGVMPPKGGRVDLSDQSIINGVDYMVSAAR
jgi:cytochrome c5